MKNNEKKSQLLLGNSKLLLQRLWHLWWRRTGQTESNLDTIIDEPLESGKSTNHDDPGTKTCPESLESKVIDCLSKTSARSLVEVRHEGVSGLGDNGAEDTSDVAGGESDHQLLSLGALGPGLGDHVLVKSLHGSLETGKLHHGVGDLSSPQRNQGLVETIETFLCIDLRSSFAESCREGSWN